MRNRREKDQKKKKNIDSDLDRGPGPGPARSPHVKIKMKQNIQKDHAIDRDLHPKKLKLNDIKNEIRRIFEKITIFIKK